MARVDGRTRSPEVAEAFGRNLRRARRRARLSQTELGDRAGLHRTEIGMLENGTRLARVDTLLKVAAALQLPAAELLADIPVPPLPGS